MTIKGSLLAVAILSGTIAAATPIARASAEPESQITVYERPDGSMHVSRTSRGTEAMVLTVVRDRQGKLVRSDIEHTKDSKPPYEPKLPGFSSGR